MAYRSAITTAFATAFLAAGVAAAQPPVFQAPPIPPLEPERSTSFQPPAPPPLTGTLPSRDIYLPAGDMINLPSARGMVVRFGPRYGTGGNFQRELAGGDSRTVYTGGIIFNITFDTIGPQQEYEFAADHVVAWQSGESGPAGTGAVVPGVQENKNVELYLRGNVVIRHKDETVGLNGQKTTITRTLRADEIFYDVGKSRAIALVADLDLKFDNVPDSVHVYGRQILRLGPSEWRATKAGAFSSKLPSDPALQLLCSEATITEREALRRNAFGIPYHNLLTGEPDYGTERILTTRNTTVNILGVPIFYTPYQKTDLSDPLGPLRAIGFGNDRQFGTQFYTTWDLYKLLALRGPPTHSWKLHLDYLSNRGPAFGSDYDYTNADFFGCGGKNTGQIRLYGLNDDGQDLLGGFRGLEPKQPDFRGRALLRHQQEIFADRDADGLLTDRYLYAQGQLAYLSDKNFFEQYFKNEFDFGPNQETFLHLAGSRGQFFGSVLAQGDGNRNWVTQTQWLPKVSGGVVGQSFFDLFNYDAKVDLAYAQLRPSTVVPPIVQPTDVRTNTGRFDFMQELSLPLDVGPVRVTPYAVLDLTDYTNDLTGDNRGRIYGGGGVRSAMTLSRTFSDVSSELFNLRGINHKATFYGNYYNAQTNVSHTQLPQLDRLNDDAIDQGYRTIHPLYGIYINNAMSAAALTNGPQFDPQAYAIRRLVLNNVDTRDDIQVLQTGIDQRWQTKRGFPGREHTVDWMSLNVTASIFPAKNTDNYGKSAALLEGNYLWNIGDQTAFVASGWFDPYDVATNFWTVGGYLQRPDGVNFYLGYRQTDPLNSKTVTAAVNYPLSRKYAVNVSTSYDFGNQLALSNTVSLIRTGTDLTMTLGFTYNALINNFGVQFAILPNLAAATGIGRGGGAVLSGVR